MITDQTLGTVVMEAIRYADTLRAGGADAATIHAGLETVVRERWPRGREADWRELCAECHDYGYQWLDCEGDATCGRQKVHAVHAYVRPCWCDKGRRMIAKPRQEADELAAVGKMGKPTRFGR